MELGLYTGMIRIFVALNQNVQLTVCWQLLPEIPHAMAELGGCSWFLPCDALLSAVYAVVVCLSVCLCVCVCVTLRYCIKTAKRRITQITPHDSPLTLVF